MDKNKVKKELIEMGAKPTMLGFKYLAESMTLLDDEKLSQDIDIKIMYIYAKIAKKFGVSMTSVQTALIRFFANFRKNPDVVKMIGSNKASKESMFILYYKMKERIKNEIN